MRAAGKVNYADITQAPEDVEKMCKFFAELNFSKVIKTENASHSELSKAFSKVRDIFTKAHKDKSGGTKVLLMVYYSGHGVMDTTTKVVCNESDKNFMYWPLESKLAAISLY